MKIKKKPAQKEKKGVVKRIDWSDSCQEPGGNPSRHGAVEVVRGEGPTIQRVSKATAAPVKLDGRECFLLTRGEWVLAERKVASAWLWNTANHRLVYVQGIVQI